MDSLNIEKIQRLVRNHWGMDKYDIMCLFLKSQCNQPKIDRNKQDILFFISTLLFQHGFFCLSVLTLSSQDCIVKHYDLWSYKCLELWVSANTLNFNLMCFFYRSVDIASEI